MTYLQARANLLDYLTASLWAVKRDLKVPHATSPDGRLRLWLKAQAVYWTRIDHPRERHDFGRAYTVAYDFDIRKLTPAQVVSEAERRSRY